MITIAEVIEQCAQIVDQQDVDPSFKHRMAAHIRALAKQYEGCIEQAGWVDEFGNVFPLSTWNGKRHWLDDHKQAWKPLYRARETQR